MKQKIYNKLSDTLSPSFLEVRDETDNHIGHSNHVPGVPSHFELKIISEKFNGMSRIAIHQEIYKILAEEMQTGIHALQIDAKSEVER